MRKTKTFICEECGREFVARADHEQKFCSSKCAGAHHSKENRKYAICPVCSTEFRKRRSGSKYCSRQCQAIARKKTEQVTCETCGKQFSRVSCHVGMRNFCSPDCYKSWQAENQRGENSPRWSGGVHIHDGYIFKKQSNGRYKGEHRVAMEEELGRELTQDEVVHHINGDKTKNEKSNLVVMTRAEHCILHRPVDKRTH